MSKVVECVPNFSEGRDQKVIDAIASSIGNTAGVTLLDVDPGVSTNRTVMTLVGSPEAVLEAALNGARTAFQLIDMSKHTGEHPRMGALDVCPFIPVRDVTIEECVQLSKRFGELLAAELDVPVFLYGAASSREYRKALPQVRSGEYEGLTDRLTRSDWTPDYGPARFVPRWGATATGVRNFLIAYNVNVLGTKEQAHRIALNIREQGRGHDQPGRLRCCRAIGWYLDEADLAQVSINLTDFNVTPMHVAFEECKKDAAQLKLGLAGSEIVGLVPLAAILQAAEFYIHKENLFVLEEKQKVRLAIERLGLSSINVFHPEKRIIEYCLPDTSTGPLASLSVSQFVRQVAARTPAPGGGSVAALCGALGAALASMVGKMTYGKRQWEHLDTEMRDLIPVFHHAVLDLVPMVDADTDAFNQYMMAMRLPRDSTEEEARRAKVLEERLKTAINTPLSLLRRAEPLWSVMERLAAVANISTKSDLQVAARCLETASWGAYNNVSINLKDLQDDQFRARVLQEADSLVQQAQDGCRAVLAVLEARCK